MEDDTLTLKHQQPEKGSGDDLLTIDDVSSHLKIRESDKFVLHLALLTLYKDQIRPHQLEVRHRLQEISCSPFLETHFTILYQSMPTVYLVESSVKKAVTIYLKETPNWFKGWVDAKDPHNPYPPYVLQTLLVYLENLVRHSSDLGANTNMMLDPPQLSSTSSSRSPTRERLEGTVNNIHSSRNGGVVPANLLLSGDTSRSSSRFRAQRPSTAVGFEGSNDTAEPPVVEDKPFVFRGGRYGMAKKLKASGPQCLRAYSLGQLCHIVQLAISQGILTYDNDLLQPAVTCRAVSCHPHLNALNEVKRNLAQLLRQAEDRRVPLSQVKLLFEQKFNQNLSPVIFGHLKLSDFLIEECDDVCRLYRHDGTGRQIFVHGVDYQVEEGQKTVQLVSSKLRSSGSEVHTTSGSTATADFDGGGGETAVPDVSVDQAQTGGGNILNDMFLLRGQSNISFTYWKYLRQADVATMDGYLTNVLHSCSLTHAE